MLHKFKLTFRRRLRKRQRQVEEFGVQTEDQLERLFFRRIGRLGSVWRFIASWLLLFALLSALLVVQLEALGNHFQSLQPVPGGVYTEGIVGTFTNANPLYATNNVDMTVSRLIFASLLKYDGHNQLVGDLAQKWSANKDGTVYTVTLRPNLKWQDGKPLTAQDVVFTYHTIQNPDAESPLNASWQGITVSASDDRTVTFKLPNPLSSFPYSLTNGIVPQHILEKMDVVDLRSSDFNTQKPVGAGPFMWNAVEVNKNTPDTAETEVELVPYQNYYAGKPKLSSFVVHAFASEKNMVASFRKHELTAVAGIDKLPSDLAKDSSIHAYSMLYTAAKMVFFNTSQGVLKDANVRRALVQGTDTAAIIKSLGFSTRPVHEPLLMGQLGYQAKYNQATGNAAAAKKALDKAGWKLGKDGIRVKDGKPLTFSLFAADTPENAQVASELKKQWQALGANTAVYRQGAADFNNTLASRGYDAVLYAVSIGTDPDVFVYWDSSQSHSANGLNFSLYKSSNADTSLEAGRTRLDPALRAVKYRSFLAAWQQDAPALGLYQPRFLYLSWGPVYGLNKHPINIDTDRFANIQNWEIREAKVTD